MKTALIAFLAAATLSGSCSKGPSANDANDLRTAGSPRPTASSNRIPRNQANSAVGLIEIFEGTLGVTEMKNPNTTGSLTLVNLYIARYGNYDGVRFEFAGAELPSYKIEYVDGPFRSCSSEEVVPVGGEAWLSIKFTGAKAHTEAGEPTIDDMTLPRDVAVLKDFKLICDTEGRVEWVFGISARYKYKVTERNDQTGIVVQVKHPER